MLLNLQRMIIRRGKGIVKGAVTLRNFYPDYKKMILEKNLTLHSYQTYVKVNSRLNELLLEEFVIKNSGTLALPHRCGLIRVKKRKIQLKNKNSLRVDWHLTKQKGKRIFHLNQHTNGFAYHFYWDKSKAIVKNKSQYRFRVARQYARFLTTLLKDPTSRVDYFI